MQGSAGLFVVWLLVELLRGSRLAAELGLVPEFLVGRLLVLLLLVQLCSLLLLGLEYLALLLAQ